ncbi:transglutaminase-like domain-containing protein [Streptomyces castrisilvae]|uniref:Transglutaminase-like domain-containing protein n=1 Tax=Streptomyces castrisilvae TaxID=3033811 RepID=A0ABY9HP53_9ACTN|nr:transglutaminase-like domain-containing protein [Streptomyces sp. Mut1]WLQ36101.1 transglutaminase-like domain-containing protein [Streptomyces sp. Mut1]
MAPGRNDCEERRRRFADEARAERPDLALLCLLVAAEADPELDTHGIDTAQIELDRLAGLLPYGLRDGRAWASALAELLGERYGFEGAPADYRRLESSLLHEVLRRRRGLPILLSVVWIEVARRAGAPVYGLALPGHFVVGFGDPSERVLADPFAGGRPLTDQDAELLVTSATGERWEPAALEPARPLEVVLRILNNIRAWAAARPEQMAVALWAVELSLLLPSHPARLRYEHAQLLVRAGEFLRGAEEMEEYARVVEEIEPAAAESVRHSARAARALLN